MTKQDQEELNVFARVDVLCDQWERCGVPVPLDTRHLLCKMVKRIVLDAAKVCDGRAKPEDKSWATRGEARKCADAVRFFLLAKEGESVCLRCDGEGCVWCGQKGIRKLGEK